MLKMNNDTITAYWNKDHKRKAIDMIENSSFIGVDKCFTEKDHLWSNKDSKHLSIMYCFDSDYKELGYIALVTKSLEICSRHWDKSFLDNLHSITQETAFTLLEL